MPSFYEIAFTPAVQKEQQSHGSQRQYQRMAEARAGQNTLGPDEQYFLGLRDSFYMASVSETGWPYIQHRGGPAGFVHIFNPGLIAFADLRGNKQYISLGNLRHDDRVALFFMDYPNQTRLKILGRVEIHESDAQAPELFAQLRTAEPGAIIERAILIHVEGFDWNCPQHITPRFTIAELDATLGPLRAHMKDLESENTRLREQLASPRKTTATSD